VPPAGDVGGQRLFERWTMRIIMWIVLIIFLIGLAVVLGIGGLIF
jgi:hypothetical protein